MTCTILWFRRDLRLRDNPALHWACEHSTRIIPLYIDAAEEHGNWAPGSASRWWLEQSLQQLSQDLSRYELPLYKLSGSTTQCLSDIIKATGATQLAYNALYEPALQQRDRHIDALMSQLGIRVQRCHSRLLVTPGQLLNNQGQPYRVFTPFYRKLRAQLDELYGHYRPLNSHHLLEKIQADDAMGQMLSHGWQSTQAQPWHNKLHRYWQPGEQAAQALLQSFIEQTLENYIEHRDIPSLQGTSRLSPYLHFGELSVQHIYHLLQPMLCGSQGERAIAAAEAFLRQLIWRDFAHHILWHYPHTSERPMDSRYSNKFWRKHSRLLQQWRQGETGVALVDAGMKQLWETGWMHNRVRMIVASFLTKNLGISWLQGARWFWDTLVDADLANNSMGWQWVAGCGVDAAPYYRIFNPVTQSKRFDAESRYASRWLDKNDHRPTQPIVDIATSRQQALQRYKQFISPRI